MYSYVATNPRENTSKMRVVFENLNFERRFYIAPAVLSWI